jgi:glycosyltransferase involved in cell wall biosynthesis
VTDVAVVTQGGRFREGAAAQTAAFLRAATELGRVPTVVQPRFVPLIDSFAGVAQARRIARYVSGANSVWVVAAAAPYGLGALTSGRPYAAWIGTSLDDEWSSRRARLPRSRRLALALNGPLLRHVERRVLRGARALYATSPASRAALAAAAGVAAETIGILPIPVDTEVFRPAPEEEWLRTLDAPTIVFVGRADDPRKNVGLLLDAWPQVRARVPNARLRLVGRPPAALLPVGVEAAGEVESVAEELRSASLFVLPSLQEGFGIVVAEALASGVPAIVTPCGGPEELVRESGGGTLLADFGRETLEAALVERLENRAALVAQRARGRAYVEVHHSPTQLRNALAAALAERARA